MHCYHLPLDKELRSWPKNHTVFCQVHASQLLSENAKKLGATAQKIAWGVTHHGNLIVAGRVYFKPRPVIEPHMVHEENKQFRHTYLHSRNTVFRILHDQLPNRLKNIDSQSFMYVYFGDFLAVLGESRLAAPFLI
jgi:hypothetical protein